MVDRGLGALRRLLPRRAGDQTTPPVAPERTTRPPRPSKLGYLSAQEIFRDLSPTEMDEIDRATAMRSVRPGQVFYEPGQTGEALFLLKKGKVALYRLSPEGRKLVTETLGPGAFFGQMAVIGQGMYDSFAEATEASTLCVMSRSDVERLLLMRPSVALRLIEVVGRRLVEAEERLEESAFKDVSARLAALLVRLSRDQGTPGQVNGLSHQDLADSLGVYRETVTSALDRLKEAGLVEVGRKRITILRPEGLEELSEG
jgi:CRP/FNR family transcriptional regulator, cyclic AMP receptor protein